MPNRYQNFMGGSQKCTQGAPPVKARNCSMKMSNCKFAWISVPASRTMQTAVHWRWVLPCVLWIKDPGVSPGPGPGHGPGPGPGHAL